MNKRETFAQPIQTVLVNWQYTWSCLNQLKSCDVAQQQRHKKVTKAKNVCHLYDCGLFSC